VSELFVTGRSPDGNFLELESEDGSSFTVEISEELRGLVVRPRLVSVVNSDEHSVVTVKEVQARLRAGETLGSIARTTDWSIEKIEKFSGPILQERAYVIGLALVAQLRKEKHSPTLSVATISQLAPRGVDMEIVEWNTWRLPDGRWNIVLAYPTKDGGTSEANWSFDLINRTLEAVDDGAIWIAGEEPEVKSQSPSHGIVYPSSTPPPRLVSVREGSESPENPEPIRISSLDAMINTGSTGADPVSAAEKRDGVTKRLKIPSWDDIMFGGSKGTSEEE
jgi:hypothetical protein